MNAAGRKPWTRDIVAFGLALLVVLAGAGVWIDPAEVSASLSPNTPAVRTLFYISGFGFFAALVCATAGLIALLMRLVRWAITRRGAVRAVPGSPHR